MNPYRNPADLLGLDRNTRLQRLLRACGTDEAYITGGGSDYDKLLALAAALPLCEGHPLRDEVNHSLTASTGLTAPLCPHTVRSHWDAWVEIHYYGRPVTATDLPAACPYCAPAAPRVIRTEDCTVFPDPTAVQAPDLTAWSQALESTLPTDGIPALYTLPSDYTFTRPNPYHAGLAVVRIAQGEELTVKERDLLVTQALRVWGLALVGKEPDKKTPLLLRGGAPDAVTALLAYLSASKALSNLVWIPDDPADVGALSGLYPQVRTGYAVAEDASIETVENKKAAYERVAPMGRAILLIE